MPKALDYFECIFSGSYKADQSETLKKNLNTSIKAYCNINPDYSRSWLSVMFSFQTYSLKDSSINLNTGLARFSVCVSLKRVNTSTT